MTETFTASGEHADESILFELGFLAETKETKKN